jgi:hypothetical protein
MMHVFGVHIYYAIEKEKKRNVGDDMHACLSEVHRELAYVDHVFF